MSKTIELLDAVKAREGITSNYALAKFLEINEARIGEYYRDIAKPDDYAITRIALALGLEPMHVLAEIRAESEKNEKKREFWRNFLMRAASVGGLAAGLMYGFPSASEASTREASGESFKTTELQNHKLYEPETTARRVCRLPPRDFEINQK